VSGLVTTMLKKHVIYDCLKWFILKLFCPVHLFLVTPRKS
jgi:hypothetical protein